MFRIIAKWMPGLTLLFALPVVLIRAQPYDDHEIHAFLSPPEGCPAPCFMGIRPGVTTAEEAIAILGESSWIDPASLSPVSVSGSMEFRFNNLNSLIDNTVLSYLSFENNRVRSLTIPTNISLIEIWMIYGRPDWVARGYPMGSDRMIYSIGYDPDMISFNFFVYIRSRCSLGSFLQHLREKVYLRLSTKLPDNIERKPTLWLFTCDPNRQR